MPEPAKLKQYHRLLTLGAKNISWVLSGLGKTIWFGELPCLDCEQIRKVSSHACGLKTYSGRCLSCSSKINVKQANAPKAKRLVGAESPLYRRGFTLRADGYRIISLHRNHPYRAMADKGGRVREHRLLMAQHLGRLLKSWEIVHHKNRNRGDNRISNLVLLTKTVHTLVTKMEQEIELLQKEIQRLNALREGNICQCR